MNDDEADGEGFELPGGKTVRIPDRLLELFDDHDECPFCIGRAAAHRGEGVETNPHPPVDVSEGSADWYETEHGLWLTGHSLGSTEPGGLLWYEQPKRGSDTGRATDL